MTLPRIGTPRRALCPTHVLRALGVAVLLVSTGCPHSEPPPDNLPLVTTTDRQAEADLRSARQLQEAGDVDEATAAYQTFLVEHASDPLSAVARLALAQIYLADGLSQQALDVLAPVVDHEDAAVRERARFYRAVAAGRLGDHATTIATLEPMVGQMVDPQETALLLTSLADAYLATGREVVGLKMLDRLTREAVPETTRTAAFERIDAVIAGASAEQVERALNELAQEDAVWPKVARRALIDADAARNVTRVRELLAALEERDVVLDDKLQEIAARASQPAEADPRVVGVVLTLSGRAREVGEVALRGVMLAAGLPSNGPRAADAPQVVFRDDAGDPARAIKAIDELVTVHRAVAIIGPMDALTARAAAARAQELGVPLIALSPQGDITERGSMVFRLLATPEEEADALVAHALRKGKRRFALLRPDSPYGKLMEAAYLKAIAQRGGELVVTSAYAPTATAFGQEVTALAAATPEVVLLADAARKVELIAPALAAGGLWTNTAGAPAPSRGQSILLMSPSVGYAPQLPRTVGRYLQGAVFSLPFNPAGTTSASRAFVDRYRAQYSSAPDAFAASAHDAYRLIRGVVDHGAKTRETLASGLTAYAADDVAGPSAGFATSRGPRQATQLVQLSGSDLVASP